MTPDYDLSNLQSCLADLWIYLQVDGIRAQILVEQAARHESTACPSSPATLQPSLRSREGHCRNHLG